MHNRRTADHELTQLTLGCGGPIFQRDHRTDAGQRLADRQVGGKRVVAWHLVPGADIGLGRAVEVQVPRVRHELHQAREVLDRKHLAGEDDHSQRRQRWALELAALHERGQRRRNRIPDRDRLLGDEPREHHWKERELTRDQDERRSAGGRREQVEDREVEVKRSVAREPVLRHHSHLPSRPEDECKAVGVREHHAFGLSGRAGRVEDVGKGVGVRCDGRSRRVVLDRVPLQPLQGLFFVGPAGGADDGLKRHALCAHLPADIRLRLRADEASDPRVARDVSQATHRRLVVQRHVHGAGLQRSVDRDHGLQGLLEQQPHAISRLDAAVDHRRGEAARPRIELGVGQFPVPVHHRDPGALPPRRRREKIMNHDDGHSPRWRAITLRCISDVPE